MRCFSCSCSIDHAMHAKSSITITSTVRHGGLSTSTMGFCGRVGQNACDHRCRGTWIYHQETADPRHRCIAWFVLFFKYLWCVCVYLSPYWIDVTDRRGIRSASSSSTPRPSKQCTVAIVRVQASTIPTQLCVDLFSFSTITGLPISAVTVVCHDAISNCLTNRSGFSQKPSFRINASVYL